jgi:hypothetical protein
MVLFKARFDNMGFLFFMTIFPSRWLVLITVCLYCIYDRWFVSGYWIFRFFNTNRFGVKYQLF